MTRERESKEVAGAARRMIRALGARVGTEDPIDLLLITELRGYVEEAFTAALVGQKAAGFSDAEIAAGLGVSRQAVTKRLAVVGSQSGDVA